MSLGAPTHPLDHELAVDSVPLGRLQQLIETYGIGQF